MPDPEAAPIITAIFETFSKGDHSLKALVRELNQHGTLLRSRKLVTSTIHQILRKRLYMGDFDWDGQVYKGTHDPLVTLECWDKVQQLLDSRAEKKTRKVKHDFAYTGLIQCGHCGCLLVGELKKSKYVYYHCTGNRAKCAELYARQELLTDQLGSVLQDLVIPTPLLEWLNHAMLGADRTEQTVRTQTIKKLTGRCEQLEQRIEAMYIDKLDGRFSQDLFDKQSSISRTEQEGIRLKIHEIEKSTPLPPGSSGGYAAVSKQRRRTISGTATPRAAPTFTNCARKG